MFKDIKVEVEQRMKMLTGLTNNILVMDLGRNQLFDAYLEALPEELRQEHNCSCCRHFLRDYGGMVAIIGGKVVTLWDFEVAYPYEKVPNALKKIVENANVRSKFFTKYSQLGIDHNLQHLKNGSVMTWEHFSGKYPDNKVYTGSETINSQIGSSNSMRGVIQRSLEELTLESVNTVLELIDQNSLYKGEEFRKTVESFKLCKKNYDRSIDKGKFIWSVLAVCPPIKNSVIGTLLLDLSQGKDLEFAVKAYESKTAPMNYKRPTALITKGMIEKAEEKINDLGLESSLHRRHATIDDIPVSDLLYVDRTKENSGLFEDLKKDVPFNKRKLKKVEEVTIEKLFSDVLNNVDKVEILLEKKHENNLVNLIAPDQENSIGLFPWSNNVSWSYNNNVADSIKTKVGKAGGAIDCELRFSLEWFNKDDLDIWVIEPNNNKISFRSPSNGNRNGRLDVDANASNMNCVTHPVENIAFNSKSLTQEGIYTILVHQYKRRETDKNGFNVEIECNNEVLDFCEPRSMSSGELLEVAKIHYSRTEGVKLISGTLSEGQQSSYNMWGTDTNRFYKVPCIMHSPNHWGGSKHGNRHYFFMVDELLNDEQPRGFYNEFLKPDLIQHRKVFEVLGNKLKIPKSDNQLAGLGFSSTIRNEVILRLTGNFTRIVKVKF